MNIVSAELIRGKRVLLRLDLDVAISNGQITEDYKIRAGIPTLNLCIANGSKVIIMGHIGRPFKTAEDEKKGNPPELSAKPIKEWLEKTLAQSVDFAEGLEQAESSNSKVILLENIRFFHGEETGPVYHASCTSKTCDMDFAKKLAALGDFYVNEAFSSYRPAVSTTVLPTLLPHVAGLRFASEVEKLTKVRNNPKKPFVAIMGGAKVKDKLPVIKVLAQKADAVLVGGKLIAEIREQNLELPENVMVGKLNESGFDIAAETTSAWKSLIEKASLIVWNGPLGMFEDDKYNQTKDLAEIILNSKAQIVIGGGDSVAALTKYGLFEKALQKAFVSVGGGAMLKLLSDGTLPTIKVLEN